MRGMRFASLACVLATLAPVSAIAVAEKPVTLPLTHVSVELPDRDTALVTLHAVGTPGGPVAELPAQRLLVGGIAVPLPKPATVAVASAETTVHFELPLRVLPESILEVDPNHAAIRFEAASKDGKPAVAIEGKVDAGDPGEVEVPRRRAVDLYASLADFSISPASGGLGVRAVVSLYNPLAFDIVVVRVEYHLAVGANDVIAGQRPGFRLKAGHSSDVLIEQEVGLADAAGAFGAFMQGAPVTFEGGIVIRTPTGDRLFPLQLQR